MKHILFRFRFFFLIILISIIALKVSAQEISRNKEIAIQNIKNSGYTIKTSNQDDNIFEYVRYDKFGKSIVQYECTGSIVRKVTFLCEDGNQALKRSSEIFKYLTREDMGKARREFGEAEANEIYTYTTMYYQGKAKYTYYLDYQKEKWYFTITLLD